MRGPEEAGTGPVGGAAAPKKPAGNPVPVGIPGVPPWAAVPATPWTAAPGIPIALGAAIPPIPPIAPKVPGADNPPNAPGATIVPVAPVTPGAAIAPAPIPAGAAVGPSAQVNCELRTRSRQKKLARILFPIFLLTPNFVENKSYLPYYLPYAINIKGCHTQPDMRLDWSSQIKTSCKWGSSCNSATIPLTRWTKKLAWTPRVRQ